VKQGDIIYVPFPYTDLSIGKIRPALVLYAGKFDVLLAFITSKHATQPKEAIIFIQPTAENGLKQLSCVRLDKFATVQNQLVLGVVGYIDNTSIMQVKQKIIALLKLDQ
jgi:mRNA interferase MazF